MPNDALLIYKKATLSEESNWAQGTITAGTHLVPMRDSGVAVGLNAQKLASQRLGWGAGIRQYRLGTLAPAFTLPMFGYPVGKGLLTLKAALGQVATNETASFTVTAGSNDKINFTEDGGAELTATLAVGTYKMGASSAEANSLCKEVKDKMEAVNGAPTYTVTFNQTTGILTITKNSGVFVLKFATGANASTSARTLLGFGSVDTASAISATAGTALTAVYSHALTIKEAIDYGSTKGLTAQLGLADGKVFDLLDCVVNSVAISYAPNQELFIDAVCEARRHADSAATLAALTAPSVDPMLFSQLTATVNGAAASLAALSVNFNNNFKTDMFINSRYRSYFKRNGFRSVSGMFAFDLTDSRTYTLYNDFLAENAGIPIVATFTGGTIKTGHSYAIAISLPKARPNFESVPGGGGAAVPQGEVPFDAQDDGSTGEMSITVTNGEASI